jgi:hypothetical protein
MRSIRSGEPRAVEAQSTGAPAPAAESSEDGPKVAKTALGSPLDLKPYIRHHPRIGYEYVPGTRYTLPRPGGGTYTLNINSAGIRSDREYSRQKPASMSRVLVLGDSYAAGQFQSNEHRFSELLERRNPGLEVMNFGLEGTGTDQQLLIYEEFAQQYEYDLVILLPFLQNIRRNMVEARVSRDPETGRSVLLPKPRFVLERETDGSEILTLHGVPVPRERQEIDDNGEALSRTDADVGFARRVKDGLSELAAVRQAKKVLFPALGYDPFPEYKDASSPEWRLMAAIIGRLSQAVGDRPLVIVPLFYVSYVRYRMAQNYMTRFSSLADGKRVHAIDILPHFRRLGPDAVHCFMEPHDPHLSAHGHLVLAHALETELQQRGLVQ